jgi:hypothetical protein
VLCSPRCRAVHLVPDCVDAQQRLLFTLLLSPASPIPCQVRQRPLSGWTHLAGHPRHCLRWIRRCRGLPGRIPVAATFLARSAVHFGRIASSRLDPSLPWPSRPDPSFPFYSAAGADTMTGADACAAVSLHGGAPRRPADRRSKEGRPAGALLLCRPRRSLTLERRLLPKNRLLLRVSRPRPPRLRLPRHLGAIVFLEHTPVSTPVTTFAPSRRYDCGRISTRRLLPSASTPISSCVVPPLRLRGMLDCVCEWAGTTVGLPAH